MVHYSSFSSCDMHDLKTHGNTKTTQTGFLQAFGFGFLLWFFYAFLTSGVYFEQWWWKVDIRLHDRFFGQWIQVQTIEAMMSMAVLIIFLVIILPLFARQCTHASQPIRLLTCATGTVFFSTILSYGVSEYLLIGTGKLEPVFRDVGGSIISFILSITFVVLLPLTLIVLGMLVWQKRSIFIMKQTP